MAARRFLWFRFHRVYPIFRPNPDAEKVIFFTVLLGFLVTFMAQAVSAIEELESPDPDGQPERLEEWNDW